ncbi:unnamed protein product [Musa hybrid cultivar]
MNQRAGISAGRRRSSRSTWKAEDCKFRALVMVSPPPFWAHHIKHSPPLACPFPSPPRYKWGKPGAPHSQPKGEEKERDRRTQKWEEVSRLPGLLPASSSSGRIAETKKLMASRSTRRGRSGRATRTEAAGLASRTWM